jgi:hypothetical protein
VAPSGIDFGTLYLGSFATKNVTLTNTGTTPVTITDPLLSIVKGGNSSEFVQLNLCPKSLAAGSHCTTSITFVAGPFYTPQTATLSITDNAPGNPQTVMRDCDSDRSPGQLRNFEPEPWDAGGEHQDDQDSDTPECRRHAPVAYRYLNHRHERIGIHAHASVELREFALSREHLHHQCHL